jgi:hypothetical protein
MEMVLQKARCWVWSLAFVLLLAACGAEPTTQPTRTPMSVLLPTRIAKETISADTITLTDTPTVALATTVPTAEPTATPTSTSVPTQMPTRISTSTPTPVVTLADTPQAAGSPTSTPTLGPSVTRTPAPAGVCPPLGEQLPAILAIEPGVAIIAGFEPQIREYLNAGGGTDSLLQALGDLTLTDADGTRWQSRAQVIAADVTGNGTPDVVVSLVFFVEGQYADGGVFVFSCQDGQYVGDEVVPLGGSVFSAVGPDPGIRAIQDTNNNGVSDIVLSYIGIIGTHANFTRFFRILEWDGVQFVDLIQGKAEPYNEAPVNNGDGFVYDTNGNRNLELVLTNGLATGYIDGGPQRERTDIWAWNGYAFTFRRWEHEPPTRRFQAVQDGDDAARFGQYEAAQAFYEQALSDEKLLGWSPGQLWPDSAYDVAPTPTPDPNEHPRLDAYVYYRTMLLYVVQGELSEAQRVYEVLQTEFLFGMVGHPYTALAKVFWEEYAVSGDIAIACAQATEYADAHADEILEPLGSDVYGYNNRDYDAKDICPFQ